MDLTPDFLSLIADIYDAALDSAHWPEVARKLGDLFQCGIAVFTQHKTSPAPIILATFGFAEKYLHSFREYYAGVSPWMPHLVAQPAGSVVRGEDIVAADDFEQSEFYNDWLKPQGFYHGIGGILSNNDNEISKVAMLRPPQIGILSAMETAQFRSLTVHLQRAASVHRQLAIAHLQRDFGLRGRLEIGD